MNAFPSICPNLLHSVTSTIQQICINYDVPRPVPTTTRPPVINTTTTTTSVTVKQPTKPVDVTPPAPAATVKQQQPIVTVKVTEPIDVTPPPPTTTCDTVTKTKPSEDVPANEPVDSDSSNDLVVLYAV